tara:strand:- start:436 stop:720 length:285 start_codon:yes stop_codon:yes gene_type:complete
MATNPTNPGGLVGRAKPNIVDDAKFSRVDAFAAGDNYFTGSKAGSSGFIITSAGTGIIKPTAGSSIAASDLNTKTVYEIGVQHITGSSTGFVLY